MLQNLFAIEPYLASNAGEAWFGVATLALAVFINATMLSKILEIWTAFNKVQNDLDSRMNRFFRPCGVRVLCACAVCGCCVHVRCAGAVCMCGVRVL